jgi:hypothetical protein
VNFPPVPLGLLDTPDTRRLLELLTEAQTIAERVDLARGFDAPEFWQETPGLPRGKDLALMVWRVRYRVEMEVCGPAGRE